MSQLMIMTSQSGRYLNFRCPYQAKVMNMFEKIKGTMVIMSRVSSSSALAGQGARLPCSPVSEYSITVTTH